VDAEVDNIGSFLCLIPFLALKMWMQRVTTLVPFPLIPSLCLTSTEMESPWTSFKYYIEANKESDADVMDLKYYAQGKDYVNDINMLEMH
jgi:hypothetical protein